MVRVCEGNYERGSKYTDERASKLPGEGATRRVSGSVSKLACDGIRVTPARLVTSRLAALGLLASAITGATIGVQRCFGTVSPVA